MITYKDLEKFGLGEKRAKAYLASLELGPATAAEIAQKSGVKRATTYVEIESLMEAGLMSTYEHNKKTLFSAESPEALKRILKNQEEKLKSAENSLADILPALLSMHTYAEEKPKVRFFEGKEGLLTMQEDFLKTKDKKIEAIYNVDDYNKVFSKEEQKIYYQTRIKKKIYARVLYNRKAGSFEIATDKLTDARLIPSNSFLFSSDLSIYGNKIAIASLQGKLVGVIIENKEMVNTLQSLFNLCWEAAEKYQR